MTGMLESTGRPSEWPFPSESRRVRAYFYLADGLALGGGVSILVGLVGALVFLLYRSFLDPAASGGIALLLVAFGYVFAQRIAAFGAARRTDPDDPPEASDWKRTRDRTTLAASTLFQAGIGAAVIVGLTVLERGLPVAVFLPFGMVLAGIALRLYGFHRLGMRVL